MTNNRPRIALATLYDERYAPIGWMCRNTLTRWGHRHGCDVVTARSARTDRPPAWHKLLMVRALLDEGYDHVVWVDADAIVVDPSVDPHALIKPRKDLALVRHRLDGYAEPVPNTGVFALANSGWSRDLLNRLWALDRYATATWWENAALIHLLGLSGFEEVGIDNPRGCEVDTSRIAWVSDRWNRLHAATDPGWAIIRHYAGRSTKHRVRGMASRLNWPKALWHEATRRPTALDYSRYGLGGATLEHAAPRPEQPAAPRRAAA